MSTNEKSAQGAEAVSESKTPEIRVKSVTTAYGAVQFRHLHVAMRGLAFVLALSSRGRPTPFDEERKDAIEAIREALSRPLSEEQLAALSALQSQCSQLAEALDELYRADYAMQFPCTTADEMHGVNVRIQAAREKARAALSLLPKETT